MIKVLNLDNLLPEDKKIILKGREIIVPGDISTKFMFQSMRFAQKSLETGTPDADEMEKAFDAMFEMLKHKNPKLDRDEFVNNLSSKQYTELVNFMNDAYTPKGQEGEEKKSE